MFWKFKHFQCLKEYVSVQMYLKVNYLARREKDEIKSCIVGEKVVMTHVLLVYPMLGEKYGVAFMLYQY